MRKLTLALVVAAMTAAIAAAPAAAKKAHNYSSTVISGTLSTGNGYPGAGGTALLAGSLTTKAFGAGALVDHITITGQKSNVVAFKGKEVDFFADGSARSTFTGTSTVNGDGSQDVVVNGRFKGGAGRFKGATGHYRFTGKVPPGSTILSGRSKGSISF